MQRADSVTHNQSFALLPVKRSRPDGRYLAVFMPVLAVQQYLVLPLNAR